MVWSKIKSSFSKLRENIKAEREARRKLREAEERLVARAYVKKARSAGVKLTEDEALRIVRSERRASALRKTLGEFIERTGGPPELVKAFKTKKEDFFERISKLERKYGYTKGKKGQRKKSKKKSGKKSAKKSRRRKRTVTFRISI